MKLEIGYNRPFEIRRENCRADCKDSFSLLYLSDLHLNRYSAPTVARITHAVEELNPTLILFGGDYADSRQGVMQFDRLLRSIAHRNHVYAIAGNHDYRRNIETIQQVVTRNNGAWMEGESHSVQIGETSVRLDGNCAGAHRGEEDFTVLILHKPQDPDTFKSRYDLALAGHLHGSQFVLWQRGEALYPGRLFYRWNRLNVATGGGQYFISKGLGDTLPVRYNCKRDMLFITVNGTH